MQELQHVIFQKNKDIKASGIQPKPCDHFEEINVLQGQIQSQQNLLQKGQADTRKNVMDKDKELQALMAAINKVKNDCTGVK